MGSILPLLLTAAALLALPHLYHEADPKRAQWGGYLTAFIVYSTLLVGVWLCVALPLLLWIKQ